MKRKIEEEADRLHFAAARRLLEAVRQEDDPVWNRLMARVLRGLYQAETALDHALAAGQDPAARLEQAKCLFAGGRIREGGRILETLMETDPSARVRLAFAAYLGETGQVHEARKVLAGLDESQLQPGTDRMDWMILSADLASFEEKTDEAFAWYRKALGETDACIPENWRPLRRMLILHNMADTYEQLEQPRQAAETYGAALLEMRQQDLTDPAVTDLSGYRMELLLSAANCHGNMEEFETAASYLRQADELTGLMPPRQADYFRARRDYIGGLIALNEGRDDAARQQLENAFRLQKRLCRLGKDKPEHLARSAYYLASVLPPEEDARRLALYETAWPVFEVMQEKEPSFYLASLAEIENERGRLAPDPGLAASHYRSAISLYDCLLRRHPQDRLAKESRLAAAVNLFTVCPDPAQENRLRQELGRQLEKEPNLLFLRVLCDYLKTVPSSPEFSRWLQAFASGLPDPFDA